MFDNELIQIRQVYQVHNVSYSYNMVNVIEICVPSSKVKDFQ